MKFNKNWLIFIKISCFFHFFCLFLNFLFFLFISNARCWASPLMLDAIDALEAAGQAVKTWSVPQLLNHLVESGHTVRVQYIHGDWLDVDDILDLSNVYKF